MRKKWEYISRTSDVIGRMATLDPRHHDIDAGLNQLGGAGWELVAVRTAEAPALLRSTGIFYFKREVVD